MELSDCKTLFESIKHKTKNVKTDENDVIEARKLPTHYADALHIVLAQKGGAEIIITNNVKDFESIFKADSPENI
jgi:predicted nucleic acid-binding protein